MKQNTAKARRPVRLQSTEVNEEFFHLSRAKRGAIFEVYEHIRTPEGDKKGDHIGDISCVDLGCRYRLRGGQFSGKRTTSEVALSELIKLWKERRKELRS
jgi:hypothetical protein